MSRLQLAQPAVRRGQKARVALAGPAGSGKTWTALTIAEALGERIILLDTERGSASLYSDRFTFDTVDWLAPYDPRELAATLLDVTEHDVVIVDSGSPFWNGEGGTLDIVDQNASRGNSFTGWKVGTPAQQQMIDAILACKAHVIVTLRSKTEYVLEDDDRGKKVPRKVGLAPVQRDGLEYEFTVVADLDVEHRLTVSKSRCDRLAAEYRPGKAVELGETLARWLETAEPELERDLRPLTKDQAQHLLMDCLMGSKTFASVEQAKPTAREMWDGGLAELDPWTARAIRQAVDKRFAAEPFGAPPGVDSSTGELTGTDTTTGPVDESVAGGER